MISILNEIKIDTSISSYDILIKLISLLFLFLYFATDNSIKMKPINTSSLENKLAQIESYIKDFEKKNLSVSKATVGWHLAHSLKVINGVITTMKTSDVAKYKNNFSFLGKVFFKIGHFPKGKAKSPKRALPPDIILEEDLKTQLKVAKKNIKNINDLNDNAYFEHPIFGNINKARVVRFLDVHTNHHLKIIIGILK